MQQPKIPPLEPMLTMEQVRQLIPLSHCQIYRMMKAGTFPDRIKIGRSRVAWFQRDIADWMNSRQRGPS